MNNKEALERVIFYAGTQQRLADILGTSKQAISHWKAGKPVPFQRAVQMERLTNGVVKADELREFDPLNLED